MVEVPGMIGADLGTVYDWNLSTVAQTYLDGAARNIPQGHALGGGTLLNGMLWNRGGVGDYDDWVALGNEGWAWSDLLPYFQRSETFQTAQTFEEAEQYSIWMDPEVHGFDGPVNVSIPHYFWNSSALLFDGLTELGIPTAYDPNTGQVAGASFLPLDLDPVTETRSTARKAYYDPVEARPNLWVSTNQYVTQILFSNASTNTDASATTSGDNAVGQGSSAGMPGGIYGAGSTNSVTVPGGTSKRSTIFRAWTWLKRLLVPRQSSGPAVPLNTTQVAVGVEFAANAESARQRIRATREIILSAGAFHSPQLLMLSGIGPAAALEELQIPVKINLPGVGSNLQDHAQVWCWYPYSNPTYPSPLWFITNATFGDTAWIDYWTTHTGPLTTGAVDGVAFPSLPDIVNGSSTITDAASAQAPADFLPNNTDATVIAGFTAQLAVVIDSLSDPSRPAYEILNANDGALTVATMHPLSRGTVSLRSPLPFDTPMIDPRYGSNPVDVEILRAAIRFNHRLIETSGMQELEPQQMYPSISASDVDLLQYARDRMQTLYHPAGTCAMMPLALGGVVDSNLLVYGTANLRVVDASIMPMLPAAHLQAVVYGIGEKAADIIRAANVAEPASTSASSTLTSTQEPVRVTSPAVVSTTFVTIVVTQTVYA